MFEEYDEIDRRIDKHFYGSLDPFFFLRIAIQFHGSARQEIVAKFGDDDASEMLDNFEESRFSTIRFSRYLASETLLLVLVSAYPFGPFTRLSSKLKNDHLNDLFHAIASKEIPKGFRLLKNGELLNFNQWIEALVFGERSPEEFDSSISDFFADEASFCADRSAINAYKHGRILKASKTFPITLQVQGDDGEFSTVFDDKQPGVSWIEWTEKSKSGQGAIHIKAEGTDADEDSGRIYVAAMMVNVMKTIRLAHLAGQESVFVKFVPKDINRAKHIRKLALTEKFSFEAVGN